MRGGEEQRPVEPVGDDVLVEQRAFLLAVLAGTPWRAGTCSPPGVARDPVQRRQDRHRQSDDHGGDQVDSHRHDEGHDQHGRVPAGGPHQRADRADLHHPHGRREQHPGQHRERDPPDDTGEPGHDPRQRHGVGERGEPRPGAGPHVDRGAGDRACGGHPAEQGGDEVGDALAEQLAVRVVALVDGHPVGDGGRQQALQCGERGGPRRPRAAAPGWWRGRGNRQGRCGQPGGQYPDPGDVEVCGSGHGPSRPRRPRRARTGPPGTIEAPISITAATPRASATAGPVRVPPHEGADGGRGGGPDLVVVAAGHSQCGRKLLQCDDDGDPRGEPLDHRCGQRPDQTPHAGGGQHHEDGPRDQAGRQDPGGPVLVGEWREHDGHGAGRPRDLQVAAAEDRREYPGDHRGDQARLRAEAGGRPRRPGPAEARRSRL